jgi:hypothetical protein
MIVDNLTGEKNTSNAIKDSCLYPLSFVISPNLEPEQ